MKILKFENMLTRDSKKIINNPEEFIASQWAVELKEYLLPIVKENPNPYYGERGDSLYKGHTYFGEIFLISKEEMELMRSWWYMTEAILDPELRDKIAKMLEE